MDCRRQPRRAIRLPGNAFAGGASRAVHGRRYGRFFSFLSTPVRRRCLATTASLCAASLGLVSPCSVAQVVDATTETTHTELTRTERADAERWSLDEREWARAKHLRSGIRSAVSPSTLSPIEVLGIHARDAAERRYYAERWALAMHAEAERVLAFQRAYDAAVARLFPNQRLIDSTAFRDRPAFVTELEAGDRIVLRVTLTCPSCDALAKRALASATSVAGIDIQIVDASADEAAIRAWARTLPINTELTRAGRVTLNRVPKRAAEADVDESYPELLVRRRGELLALAYAAL